MSLPKRVLLTIATQRIINNSNITKAISTNKLKLEQAVEDEEKKLNEWKPIEHKNKTKEKPTK